jgi:hypothetical protein
MSFVLNADFSVWSIWTRLYHGNAVVLYENVMWRGAHDAEPT